MSFVTAYITFPDKKTAEEICSTCVSEKLAACANIYPIQSIYWWDGEVQNEQEFVGLLKTTHLKWPALEARIEDLHPYEVPCILQQTVEANQEYEMWIRSSTFIGF